MTLREQLLDRGLDDAILYTDPGYDAAALGTSNDGRVVYDYERMVECLILEEGWTEEDAREWIDYNVLGGYVGDKTPIVVFPFEV